MPIFSISVLPCITLFGAQTSLMLQCDNIAKFSNAVLLPPLGFGLWAKTRGGTLGFPACIHIRNFKM